MRCNTLQHTATHSTHLQTHRETRTQGRSDPWRNVVEIKFRITQIIKRQRDYSSNQVPKKHVSATGEQKSSRKRKEKNQFSEQQNVMEIKFWITQVIQQKRNSSSNQPNAQKTRFCNGGEKPRGIETPKKIQKNERY